jgi:methylase of polypeptide subunit release factors
MASFTPMDSSPTQDVFDSAPARALLVRNEEAVYPRVRQFAFARLIIERDVFDPTMTNVSPFLLDAIRFSPNERALDMFCGSGAFAVNAALRGASAVVAVDISEAATNCTQQNARLNGVSDKIDVRTGTMNSCLQSDETFDLIIANPPLLPGDPDSVLSTAVFDPGLSATVQFIEHLAIHLAPLGRCYLLTSDVIERLGYDVDRLCRKNGLESSIVAKAELGYECYRVHLIGHEAVLNS